MSSTTLSNPEKNRENREKAIDIFQNTHIALDQLDKVSKITSMIHVSTKALLAVGRFIPPLNFIFLTVGAVLEVSLTKTKNKPLLNKVTLGIQGVIALGMMTLVGLATAVTFGALAAPIAPLLATVGFGLAALGGIAKAICILHDDEYKEASKAYDSLKNDKDFNKEEMKTIIKAIKNNKVAKLDKGLKERLNDKKVDMKPLIQFQKQKLDIKLTFLTVTTHTAFMVFGIAALTAVATNPIGLAVIGLVTAGLFAAKKYGLFSQLNIFSSKASEQNKLEHQEPEQDENTDSNQLKEADELDNTNNENESVDDLLSENVEHEEEHTRHEGDEATRDLAKSVKEETTRPEPPAESEDNSDTVNESDTENEDDNDTFELKPQ